MAVTSTSDRQYSHPVVSPDRRFPIKRWTFYNTALGDSGGGFVNIVNRFLASSPSGLIYSLEDVNLWATGNTGQGWITAGGWRRFTRTTPSEWGKTVVINLAGTGGSYFQDMSYNMRPQLLGTKPTTIADVVAHFGTNTDGATYFFWCWGYVWRPSSPIEGGLLRPGEYPY